MNVSLERVSSRAWLLSLAMVIGSTGLGVASLSPPEIEPVGDVAPGSGPVAGNRGRDVTGPAPVPDEAAPAAAEFVEVWHDPGVGGSERPEAGASDPRENLGRGRDRRGCPEHPYPCGGEWPGGLEGPFELREVQELRIISHDGTVLHGWVGLPDVPPAVKVPVALHSSPYLGGCSVSPFWGVFCDDAPSNDSWWQQSSGSGSRAWGVDPIELIRRGYAAAFFSVRGTGSSGGCLDLQGPDEQRDQAVLVETLAGQKWSNGRVAMGGVSWPGTTPLEAAVQHPSALKTVVVGGIVSDAYTFNATPQGAYATQAGPFWAGAIPSVTAVPHLGSGVEHGLVGYAGVAPERACPELAEMLTTLTAGGISDDRNGPFYASRRLVERFPEITAAVLLTHGFFDNSGHAYQADAVWSLLQDAPRRQITGQWGHSFPVADHGANLDPSWTHNTWPDLLFGWLDFWLKGLGDPSDLRLQTVDYQDDLGRWHTSTAWPPHMKRQEVLYLAGHLLSSQPDGHPRRFRSTPNLFNSPRGAKGVGFPIRPWSPLCPPLGQTEDATGVVYLSQPFDQDVVVAGNPFAYLQLESDLAGGIVTLRLTDLGPDFSCDPLGQATGARVLTWGGADLRFHQGGYLGRDFPTGTATPVRIDLLQGAHVLRAGHRLALEVSYGETHTEYSGQPYTPQITLHPTSHLVLPVTQGSLGGTAPTVDYPPRPFVPVPDEQKRRPR